jgi:hypothetical protein
MKQLAEARGEVECWRSDDFEANGQMQLFVYKQAGRLTGIASFLVDQGVVGLKDAWTRLHLGRGEFEEMLDKCKQEGIRMMRCEMEEVRRWVAGGMRWAHENGMRLPKELTRTAMLIGGVGDWESADVTGFVKEFAGHPEDLRQRLIGEPLESYLQRKDVAFVFSENAPYMDQETGEYAHARGEEGDQEEMGENLSVEELKEMAEQLLPAVRALVEGTKKWLEERGEEASGELVEAWNVMMLSAMMSSAMMPEGSQEEVGQLGEELLENLSAQIEASRVEEYDRALDQVLEHLNTDTEMMQKALAKYGLADGPEGN